MAITINIPGIVPAPPAGGGPPPPPPGFTQLGTHTFANFSGSTQANADYKSTESFSPGQINPATESFAIQNNAGGAVTYQYDEVSLWPAGTVDNLGNTIVNTSVRNLLFTIFAPSVTAGGNHQLKIGKVAGVYSPSTTHVIGDLTSNSQIQVKYKDVINADTLIAIGSGNFTFDVNTAIGLGQYTITSNGPCRMAVYVFGQMTDDVGGAAYANLLFETSIDVLYNPSSPTTVLSINFRVEVSNPYADSTPGTLVPLSGFFQILNVSGLSPTGTVRDFSADTYSFANTDVTTGTFNGSTYVAGPGGIHLPSNDAQLGECYKFSVTSGSAPGGMTAGTRYFLVRRGDDPSLPTSSDYVYPTIYPNANYPNSGQVNITSNSTAGTFLFTRYQVLFPYQSIFLCAKNAISGNSDNDQGDRFWLGNTGSQLLIRNLDGVTNATIEKARVQSTGLTSGWDLTTIPDAFTDRTGSTQSAGPHYRPGAACQLRIDINAGSPGFNVGPHCEWEARIFCREGRVGRLITELDVQRRNDLTCAHLTYSKILSKNTNRIIPLDNGPNNVGGSYPVLGPPSRTMQHTLDSSQFVVATQPTPGFDGSAPFRQWNIGSAFHPDSVFHSHWTYPGLLYYTITGDEDMIRMAHASAECAISTSSGADTLSGNGEFNTRNLQYNASGGGPTFYAQLTPFGGEYRVGMCLIAFANGLAIGDETRPEKAYFKNVVDQNLKKINFLYHDDGGGVRGWKDTSSAVCSWVSGASFISVLFHPYMIHAWCMIKNVTRHPLAKTVLDLYARGIAISWDESAGFSSFFGPSFNQYSPSGFNIGDRVPTASTPSNIGWDGSDVNVNQAHGTTLFPASLNDIFPDPAGFWNITASGGVIDYSSEDTVINTNAGFLGQGTWALQNNDQVIPSWGRPSEGPYNDSSALPPELNPGTGQIFYVWNVNTSAKTCQLATGPGGAGLITSYTGAPYNSMQFGLRSSNAPALGSVTSYSTDVQGTSYFGLAYSSMQESLRSGSTATGLATGSAKLIARWQVYQNQGGYAAFAPLVGAYGGGHDGMWRLIMTNAVPVI